MSIIQAYLCIRRNDEFDSTESDEILEDLMPPVVDQEQMDFSNQVCTITTGMSCMAFLSCDYTGGKERRPLHQVVWSLFNAQS